MSESIIQIRNLTKTFGQGEGAVHALEDISLDIRQGEIFGIIGLSGAGKSTLVRCMNLLERPTSGTVIVDGKDMTALSETELRQARRSITMIFQSFNLLMQRTVLQNVCLPLSLSGLPKARQKSRALELLDLVGLADRADAYPAQLSGGMLQRAAAALLLALHPRYILADEPTSALDAENRTLLLELLEKQTEELESQMESALEKTGYAEFLLSIKGIGVVTLAACLGELGDPTRFESPRQMSRMAGYNLVEDSSGKNKSGTKISKRGRKNLRSVLYQMSLTMVATNDEMKQLYHYLKTREKSPLRKMQALIVVSKKILTLIHTLAKKKESYDPEKVFGTVRREQFKAAA